MKNETLTVESKNNLQDFILDLHYNLNINIVIRKYDIIKILTFNLII